MKFLTEQLQSKHKKSDFSCGKSLLDDYLHKQAGQDVKRKLAACFVLTDGETSVIKGYYTLSSHAVLSEWIPEDVRKKLPPAYRSIPATLLGRLAVDKRFQGHQIGRLLLIDALKRSYEASISVGSFAVIVDPLDDEAKAFYRQFGFIELPDNQKMFLPMNTIKQLFEDVATYRK